VFWIAKAKDQALAAAFTALARTSSLATIVATSRLRRIQTRGKYLLRPVGRSRCLGRAEYFSTAQDHLYEYTVRASGREVTNIFHPRFYIV
jgi:hypothetical protein